MDFKVNGVDYRSKKLNAFKQLFVSRRILKTVKSALTKEFLAEIVKRVQGDDVDIDPMEYFRAFLTAVGDMSDQDLEFIVNTCCESCLRMRGTDAFPLIVNERHMFSDISPVGYLTISYRVISEDLGSFFEELRSLWETEQMRTE